MAKEQIIVSVDIGSSKVCCLVGLPRANGIVDVLGYGICHHDCMRRGTVLEIKGVSEAIGKAVFDAEEISGKKAQSVFFNMCGSYMRGMLSHGEVVISDRDNEITRHDVERVLASAKSINLPFDSDIIHLVKRGFLVDGEKGIINPAGMFGLKLETDLYLVTAKLSMVDNLKKAVRQAGLGIEGHVISGIATAQAVLSQQEKDLGVMLVDIGADMTEVLVFLEGKLAFYNVVPIGGDTITRAVSDGLRLPEGIAERLKIEHGTLEDVEKDEIITLPADDIKKKINRLELRNILYAEYEKLFTEIRQKVTESGCLEDASSGAVICGQPAMMDGCLEESELILNLPVKMGHIMGLGTSPKSLPSHIYASAVGLFKYCAQLRDSKRSLLTMGPKNMVLAAVDRLKNLYHDYF